MAYKIVIEKCADAKTAQDAAGLVAPHSSLDTDEIAKYLLVNNISVKLAGMGQDQVEKLVANLRSLGAKVTAQGVVGRAAHSSPAESKQTTARRSMVGVEDDEDEDNPSDPQNLIKNVDARKDIFRVENERKLLAALVLSLIIGISLGFWFNGLDFVDFSKDFFERLPPERTAKLVIDVPKIEEKKPDLQKKKKKEKKELEKKKKTPKPKSKGMGGGGKGDPRARITRKGVLGIISGKRKGAAAGRSILSGKFAKDIDAVLDGIGGLKRTGRAGRGRKGLSKVGYNAGYGSGWGDGSGGIDGMLDGLFGGGADIVNLKKKGKLKIDPKQLKTLSAGPMAGGRSQADIMRVVMQHIAGLRYAYNKRLKQKPSLKGKITVRFKINKVGNVIDATVVASTMGDPTLEKEVVSQILRWRFDPVDKDGIDVVEYPFAFSR